MMLPEIESAFRDLDTLRSDYFASSTFINETNRHVEPDKWSVGEVIYHCYLLLKLTRQFSQYYLPIARMVVKMLPSAHSNNTNMNNIYAGKTMKAPFILNPKRNHHYHLDELLQLLDDETLALKKILMNLSEHQTLRIKFPDPVPKYPNVVQVVKLLYIHEKHHYEVVSARNEKYQTDI
ncbi:DinB family protein [Macrococcoides goetzii]|uniref:DinB family protein n=1 Tax=Macrococcus sp. PK TaxID=2801919 RepID=UPI001F10B6E8|nr:DinB family protein [Macrococcus sp. PK]